MREALTLGNGLVGGSGRGTDDSSASPLPASYLKGLPKSLRRGAHKGFKAGLRAAKTVIKGRNSSSTDRKLLMKALPACPDEAPGLA